MKSRQVRALFTEKDAMEGPSELTIIAGRMPYIQANRAALVDYFEDTNRAMRWILDPKNREGALKLVADFTKKPESDWSNWIFTKGDDYHAPDSRPDVAAMQKNLDIAKQLGVLKENIDVKAYADLSLVDEAAARVH
jgi:NitT/TauT family transport system substrate-binding protein